MSVENTNEPVETVVDGLTDAERVYFQTGEASDALVAENKELPVVEALPIVPDPAAVKADPAPPAEEVGDEPGATPEAPPKRVGWKKYEAELTARQELERKYQDQQIKNARVEERLTLLQQALQEPQAPQQVETPDPEKDIFGYARYLETRLNEVVEKVTGYEQQIQTGQQEMESERKYFDAMNTFAGKEPNFVHAYNFLLRNRAAELMAPRYPQATFEQLMRAEIPPDVGETLRQEERSLYRDAFEKQVSPAEQIFRMAQLRGFRPQKPAEAAPAPKAPGTPLAQVPAGATSVTAQVEAIKKGQTAAASLSQSSGSAGAQELTPEALANMSDVDFANLFNQLQESGNKDKLKQFFGA